MNLQELPASGDSVTAANENSLLLDGITIYGKDPDTTSGLTWGYHGTPSDSAQDVLWGGFTVAAGTFTLTDDSDNYIVVLRSDGSISCSATSTNWDNTTDYARVYQVTTVSGAVTAIKDYRYGPNGVYTGVPGTDGEDGADGGTITVEEAGSPLVSVASVSTVVFDGATVTDDTGGQVTVTITGDSGVSAVWAMANSTSQTLTNNTSTQLTFDTAVIDSGGSVIDLANERFVAPATGIYLVIAHWCWENTVPVSGNCEVRVNGTVTPPLIRQPATAIAFGSLQGAHPLSLAAGDFVTLFVTPGAVTGVTSRGNASSHLRSQFSLVRIA